MTRSSGESSSLLMMNAKNYESFETRRESSTGK
jgi:hypothetical protein